MAQKGASCLVCKHKDRAAIEKALLDGETLRNITNEFGPSPATLFRHKPHMARAMARASAKRDEELGGSLLDKLARIELNLERLARVAEANGQLGGAVGALREFRETLRMVAEIRAKLPAAPGAARIFPIFDSVVDAHGARREGLFWRRDAPLLPGFIEPQDVVVWVRYGDQLTDRVVREIDMLPEPGGPGEKVN